MSESKFKRIKAHLKNSTKDRLNFIAYEEFASQHVEAIDTLKMQNNELMIVQSQTTNPHVKVRCAEVIRENLRLPAELYDANPFVGNLVDKLNTVHTTQIHD